MKPQTFDALVHNRADKNIQDRIRIFKDEIRKAVLKLYPQSPGFGAVLWSGRKDQEKLSDDEQFNRQIVLFLTGRSDTLPAVIWEKEREKVAAELLATMDVMAQALATPPPSEDAVKPESPKE